MDRTQELLKKSNALMEGHFLLSSGKHSDKYVQSAKLIANPKYCEEVANIIAEKVKKDNLDVSLCVGPAMGGIIIAYEVARSLGVGAFFTERVEGKMKLRRGFEIKNTDKILLVEDVITTGKSSFETVEVLEALGGKVVGLSCIANRSKQTEINNLKIYSATEIDINSWDEKDIPERLKNIPLVEPGSRHLKK
ncbi:MAG: orotate phosphoribosyltransferase [Peptoniphilaceae bacterium]|nr:orotate phosphoribosyltransferase [Peptoniphilaceae bacterium]MDD7383017.1 orotate phosphoribosyltransferase [Peptoniphilaceae bacterium]MDY3737768.1 orotate phosphoribosyltransferase [Peptoniphilaceae bacterium]